MLPSCLRHQQRLSSSTLRTKIPKTTRLNPNRSSLFRPFAATAVAMSPAATDIASPDTIAAGKVPASTPGEQYEVRQTHPTEDYEPDPSKSLPLSPARQRLVDDIIELYNCKPTIERVKRYTPDCVYDDQFVYANDRYKMAGQWFALPKLFKDSTNHGYQVVVNEPGLIQLRNKQSWTFAVIPMTPLAKTTMLTALVSLSLDPATIDSDFIQVKYHKDQGNDKDYSHEGLGFKFKKWQADTVMKHMDSPEVKLFEADKGAGKEHVRQYGSGAAEGNAPVKET